MRLALAAISLAALVVAFSPASGLPERASAQSAVECPADLVCTYDVAFKRADGIALGLDVYEPAAPDGERPAVVAIHGGGFRIGDKSQMSGDAIQLVRDGFVVFAPDYRLADCAGQRGCDDNGDGVYDYPLSGTAGYDDLYNDVADSVAWVRRQGDEYGADPDHVGSFGTSAGAHLALAVNYRGRPGAERTDAAVGWSGPWVLDLRHFGLEPDEPADPDYLEAEGGALAACEWASSSRCSERWIEQSVTTHVDDCGSVACDPPARMVQSRDDPVVDEEQHGEIMLELLEDAGIEGELRTYVPGESCDGGAAPVPAGGCGNLTDCGERHASFRGCTDPRTGTTETVIRAEFLRRHLRGRVHECRGERATIAGTNRRDRIRGTAEDDVIAARGGRDRIRARGGDDLICGGAGKDRVRGGAGRDREG